MNQTLTVRQIAREQGVDLQGLIRILQHRRKAGTGTEEEFVKTTLDIIPGMKADGFGNRFLTVGENPTVLWSCHTDTVSSAGGMQNVRWKGDILELNGGKPGMSLGADDGAGMWLLLEMIKGGVPGLYIFHREEEIGGNGSDYISRNEPDLLDGIKMAIAFDRKGTTSVITHQRFGRCCSEKFAEALAAKLSPFHKTDDGGTFTDTANYVDQIGECTNISIGYQREHGHFETLDVAYLLALRATMLTIDMSDLPVEREPGEVDYSYYNNSSWTNYRSQLPLTTHQDPNISKMHDLVKNYPHTMAKLLDMLGYEADKVEAGIMKLLSGNYPKPVLDRKEDDEPDDFDYDLPPGDDTFNFNYNEIDLPAGSYMLCRTCQDEFTFMIEGFEDRCPECGSDDIVLLDDSVHA